MFYVGIFLAIWQMNYSVTHFTLMLFTMFQDLLTVIQVFAIFWQYLRSTGDDINYWVYVLTLEVITGVCNLTRQGRLQKTTTTPIIVCHSLTAALDQLRVVASSTSNDPGPRSRQHQQIGQRLLPLAAANFSVCSTNKSKGLPYTFLSVQQSFCDCA